MDFPWESEFHHKFITNVGLITSNGPNGVDIMAAEWTYLTSYAPAIIVVSVGPRKATAENIRATKQFGVSLAAENQNALASIAGESSGHTHDKVSALKELGFTFSTGAKTGLLLVEGSALMAECKVNEIIERGDHHLFIGEVLDARISNEKPLAYHQNKYWKIDSPIPKPSEEERAHHRGVVEKHRKRIKVAG